MATTRVVAATMKVAQINKPGGEFEVVEREIPKPGAREVLIKVQACGVCHSDVFVKEALWREFSIRGFLGTKLQVSSMSWAPGSRNGGVDSASVSAGTAGRTTPVPNAGVDTSSTAAIPESQASATTEDISNTWSLPSKHWRQYRTHLPMSRQPPCCARESLHLTLCDTAVHCLAILSPCKASAALDTLAFNTRANSATRWQRSGEVLKIRLSRRSWGRAFT